MYTDIGDVLDLPLELAATIIPQRVGCNPEDSLIQREIIDDEVDQLLRDGLRTLGFTLEPTTEEPMTEEPTTDGSATEEPTTEGSATEEPTTEGSATEEPTTEGSATEEPMTEGSATEEPTTEGPMTG